jgi:tRNA U38,U39,U40 pseudouridine synthase TruA
VGTKNYHNYTDDKEFTDPSANRFIMSFNVVEVFPHRGAAVAKVAPVRARS